MAALLDRVDGIVRFIRSSVHWVLGSSWHNHVIIPFIHLRFSDGNTNRRCSPFHDSAIILPVVRVSIVFEYTCNVSVPPPRVNPTMQPTGGPTESKSPTASQGESQTASSSLVYILGSQVAVSPAWIRLLQTAERKNKSRECPEGRS